MRDPSKGATHSDSAHTNSTTEVDVAAAETGSCNLIQRKVMIKENKDCVSSGYIRAGYAILERIQYESQHISSPSAGTQHKVIAEALRSWRVIMACIIRLAEHTILDLNIRIIFVCIRDHTILHLNICIIFVCIRIYAYVHIFEHPQIEISPVRAPN